MEAVDTIVALSSAPGRAGIAVVRCSGPKTRFAIETIAGVVPKPRVASIRTLAGAAQEPIDQAVLVFFEGPASFTGEDLAEFHIHGSPAVTQMLISTLLSMSSDIRLAQAGEFTRRALDAGKLSLAQVEATIDLIDSDTEWQRRQAIAQLGGAMEVAVQRWRSAILAARMALEADIDFTDEDDVPDDLKQRARHEIEAILPELEAVLAKAHYGERLREGFVVVLAGPPNAGKSSLLNAIAKRDVAIVSPIAGTTRDLIEVKLDLGGLPVTMIDTAGLRESADEIEQLGMARTRQRVSSADLVLWLAAPDVSLIVDTGFTVAHLVVQTKCDIAGRSMSGDLAVSALTGEGLDVLISAIRARLIGSPHQEPALITRERHRIAVSEAVEHLKQCLSYSKKPAELMAEDLRLASAVLQRLIGKMDSEDVLDAVFAGFCIGK
jgi:tRNA modification GTPase